MRSIKIPLLVACSVTLLGVLVAPVFVSSAMAQCGEGGCGNQPCVPPKDGGIGGLGKGLLLGSTPKPKPCPTVAVSQPPPPPPPAPCSSIGLGRFLGSTPPCTTTSVAPPPVKPVATVCVQVGRFGVTCK